MVLDDSKFAMPDCWQGCFDGLRLSGSWWISVAACHNQDFI